MAQLAVLQTTYKAACRIASSQNTSCSVSSFTMSSTRSSMWLRERLRRSKPSTRKDRSQAIWFARANCKTQVVGGVSICYTMSIRVVSIWPQCMHQSRRHLTTRLISGWAKLRTGVRSRSSICSLVVSARAHLETCSRFFPMIPRPSDFASISHI